VSLGHHVQNGSAADITHVSLGHHVQNGSAAEPDSLSKPLPRDYSTVKFEPSHKSSAEIKERENSSALLLVFAGCGNGRAHVSIFLITAL
jgi:hypothetical protein